MTGFFCNDDYSAKLSKLTDEEVGRLFRALMDYHASGKIAKLEIRESIAFDFIKEDIDKAEEAYRKKCEQASANRRKGLTQQTTKDNGRQRTLTDVNGSDHVMICNDMGCKKDVKVSSFIDEAEATGILLDHNRVIDAAEDAGFQMSNTVRASLIQMYAEYGLEKVLSGIRECVTHGAPNLAYLGAVLKGKPKKPVKVLPAQQYEQRDYSSVQAEIESELDREMEEYMRNERGTG
jgi:hypothetical protein